MLVRTHSRMTVKGAKFGTIAGLIATWSISTFIAASEFELGLPLGTFYSIMGISLGLDNVTHATYLGFLLHLATGAILGAIVGTVSVRWTRMIMLNPYKSALAGLATGMVLWLVLFLPATAILIQPSLQRAALLLASSGFSSPLLSADLDDFFIAVSFSAIGFHLLWGMMFGFIASSLLRIEIYRQNNRIHGQSTNKPASIALFGLAAGLISSLAISGLLLVAEKSSSVPIGTFYSVLASAIAPSSVNAYDMVVSGFLIHLAAGSIIGLVLSIPFALGTSNRIGAIVNRYSPVYGLVFGGCLWLVLFIPVTFGLVIPFLNSIDFITITQQVPTGEITSFSASKLQGMIDRILIGALAFNIFYGLLTVIILKSMSDNYTRQIVKGRISDEKTLS